MVEGLDIRRMIARIAFILALTLSATALAQGTSSSGVGVGAGATAVDPSKNVLDALLAAVTRLNDLAIASTKRGEDLREADNKFQNALRDAETRRVNEMAIQKQVFDLELARIIRANQESSALLLATQVKDLKTDTGERMTKLEQFANEQRGRSSATDPATIQLYADVSKLKTALESNAGVGTGRSDMYGWIIGGFMFLIVLFGTVAAIAAAMRNGRAHEHEDAERYRQFVDRKVSGLSAPPPST